MVVRVLIVDRHPMVRRNLEETLPAVSDGGVRVVAGTDLVATVPMLVRRCRPDVALLDLELPPPGPLAALTAMRRVQPRLPVLVTTRRAEFHGVVDMLAAGASGVLLTIRSPAALVPSLLAAAATAAQPAPRQGPTLTPKERHLWTLIASGASTAQIARALHVSDRTVKRLTAGLLRTLGVASRTEAAALAGRTGLLDGPPSAPTLPAPRDGASATAGAGGRAGPEWIGPVGSR